MSGTGKGWRRVGAFNEVYYRDYDGQWDDFDYDIEFDLAVMQFGGVEFGDLEVDDQGAATGALLRGSAFVDKHGNAWFVSYRLGSLTAEFIGDMAVDENLLGYIEGAAPVPSENMTSEHAEYESMNKVVYTESKKGKRVWASSRDAGIDAEFRLRLQSFLTRSSTSYSWTAESQVAVTEALYAESTAALGGKWDDKASRWVPSNRGIAVVSTAGAKVFALRLKSNPETVVAYRYTMPPTGPTVTVMTFAIDSKYIQNGNLKSYQADTLADDLQAAMLHQAKAREAYYTQYNANAFAKLPTSLAEVAQTQFVASYSWTYGGGFHSEEPSYEGSWDTGAGGEFKILGMVGVSLAPPKVADEVGIRWSLTALAGAHLNLSVRKTEGVEQSVELKTEFADKLDRDPKKGQVEAYSWKTFCTEQSNDNFDTLFSKVIDKNWLMSDDATAKAFVGMMKKRKPVWRILHRVTDIKMA